MIAGNWKMNGLLEDSIGLARDVAERRRALADAPFDMVICPPFPLLTVVGEAIADSGVMLGAQNCHHQDKGAHTGDVSPALLAALGCTHVILGHSERRDEHHESDQHVAAKVAAAHRHGLTTIVCIGETQEQHEAGRTLDVVKQQIAGSVPKGSNPANTVIAYEPVWAIGSGLTPTPDDVAKVHDMVREDMCALFGEDMGHTIRVLYGGSVKPENAAELLALDNVDGGLIGGASLKSDSFWGIAEKCL